MIYLLREPINKLMSGRLKINYHRGSQLGHRSGDFLNYNKRDKLTFASTDRYRVLDYNPRYDKLLLGLKMSLLLVVISVFVIATNELLLKEKKRDRTSLKMQKAFWQAKENAVTMEMVLNCGLIELERGNFGQAQREFEHYLPHNEPNIKAALGMAVTMVSRCEKETRFCPRAKEYLAYAEKVHDRVGGIIYEGSIEKLKERMEELPY